MKIAYLVHDFNDPAVHRRLRMLHSGGASVTLLGFCRGEPPAQVEGCRTIPLGRTYDARLVQRMISMAKAAFGIARLRDSVAGVDVVMARQLEMLVLAALARRRHAPDASLVFECLDIHRLMTGRGWSGRAMRLLERSLLGRCQLLMVSSLGFVREYFAKNYRRLPAVFLAENKVLSQEIGDAPAMRARVRPGGPPWRVGWFGNVRCRRSLVLLAGLTRRFPGKVEVVIRGRPALNVISDFSEIVAAHPGIVFHGPYDRRKDLAAIYGGVHFAWTIDFYEAGGNSEWLLPNRLYEGSLFGTVPLALASVETGRWLAGHGAGILLDDPLESSLDHFFTPLDEARYRLARMAVDGIPLGALLDDTRDCQALVHALGSPGAGRNPAARRADPACQGTGNSPRDGGT